MDAFLETDAVFRFIVDKPTTELLNLIEDQCFYKHVVETIHTDSWEDGNERSYFRQLDIASRTDDKVFLLEDDYYLLPNAGVKIEKALDRFECVTPYLHPGYFTEEKHNYPKEEEQVDDLTWLKVIDTTLTFATHGKIIRDNLDKFKSNSVWDEKMWKELGIPVWCPKPTLGTHMETDYLSSGVDWEGYFK